MKKDIVDWDMPTDPPEPDIDPPKFEEGEEKD